MVISGEDLPRIQPGTIAPEEARERMEEAIANGDAAMLSIALRGDKMEVDDDAGEFEGISEETRAAFPNSDRHVLAWAESMGCKTAREVVLGAYRAGDIEMMCRASGMENMPWDVELLNKFASDGNGQIMQWMYKNAKRDGVPWLWDATTCAAAFACFEAAVIAAEEALAQGKPPVKTTSMALILWMHGKLPNSRTQLSAEQQPCHGACENSLALARVEEYWERHTTKQAEAEKKAAAERPRE